MVWLAIIFWVLGAVCLIIEMFIPGFGVFGISGIILLIISAVLTIVALPYGVFIVMGEIAVIGFTASLLASYIRKKQLYGKLILNETLNEDAKEIGELSYFLGKQGVTKTSLRPMGMADFNGVQMQVCADGAYIPENRQVKVVDIRHEKIVVQQLNTNS